MKGATNNDVKNILGLKLPTDPRWVNLAEMQLEEILTDHAYCEQKAATTCITLITKNPEKELLVEQLSPIVTEEWGHFRKVLKELKKRGLQLGVKRKDEYLFINLSEYYIDKKNVRKRWKEWLDYEKDLMKSEELRGDRIH